MKDVERYHAENPLDLRAKPGVMYPGEGGDWVRYEDYRRLARELLELQQLPRADEDALPRYEGNALQKRGAE